MIGVFDSGYGGLTILREIQRELPAYATMYLGDNARAPYGEKSAEEIIEYTKQGANELFNRGCALVILGCNTASAVALRHLQQTWMQDAWPQRKLLGIVVPTIEQITDNAEISGTIGVLATRRTVESGSYEQEIHKRRPNIRMVQRACNNLAGAIEEYGPSDPRVQEEAIACVSGLLDAFAGLSREALGRSGVLLGCTHYELIADTIKKALPRETKLFHQPSIVAKSLKDYLVRHAEIDSQLKKTGEHIYLTTGNPEKASRHATLFFGRAVAFTGV